MAVLDFVLIIMYLFLILGSKSVGTDGIWATTIRNTEITFTGRCMLRLKLLLLLLLLLSLLLLL